MSRESTRQSFHFVLQPPAINVAGVTNTPPTLALVVTDAIGASVSVKRGTPYILCQAGVSPTADKPCEPGVIATDAQDGSSIQV